jgi:hypothetical protein
MMPEIFSIQLKELRKFIFQRTAHNVSGNMHLSVHVAEPVYFTDFIKHPKIVYLNFMLNSS